jgi:hypothetical protein
MVDASGIPSFPASTAQCQAASSVVASSSVDFGEDCGEASEVDDISKTVEFPAAAAAHPSLMLRMRPDDADASDNWDCSADAFSIRPGSASLAWLQADGATPLDNAADGQTGDPAQKAGSPFILAGSYSDGSPLLPLSWRFVPGNSSALTALWGQEATFSSSDFKASNGNAPAACSGGTLVCAGVFLYNEVGSVKGWTAATGALDDNGAYMQAEKLGALSGDWPGKDCIQGSSAAAADATGKIGCNVPNGQTGDLGRFYPAYFSLNSGSFYIPDDPTYDRRNSCQKSAGYLYMGQSQFAFKPVVLPLAADGATVLNLYKKDASGGVGGAVDATAWYRRADGKVVNFVPDGVLSNGHWSLYMRFPGSYDKYSLNVQTSAWSLNPTTFAKARSGKPDGPYRGFRLAVFRDPNVEPDPVEMAGGEGSMCPNWTGTVSGTPYAASQVFGKSQGASDDSCIVAQDSGVWAGNPIDILYGRLDLHSAYGPEDATLAVPVDIQYWDENHWATNQDDQCTALTTQGVLLHDGQPATGIDSIGWGSDSGTVSGATVSNGSGSYILEVKGGQGEAMDIDAQAMGVYDASSGATSVAQCPGISCSSTNGWLDPGTARICIGRCGQRSGFIFERQMVAP